MFENSSVIQLSDDLYKNRSFDLPALKGKDVMVLLYAPYCPHCRDKEQAWRALGDLFNNGKLSKENCVFGSVDVTENNKISDDLNVSSIPRFVMQDSNGDIKEVEREYMDDILSAVNNQ